MTQTYSISGMICTGCADFVKEQIEKHPEVNLVETFREENKIVISMNQEVPIAELREFLDKDSEWVGKFSIN